MVRYKLDAKGRSTTTPAGKRMREALGIPKGVGYCVPVPGHLLESPSWLVMTDQCRKLLDGLMAEHAAHAGVENGNLKQPYDQLAQRGMRRGSILNAIVEARALGLIDYARGVCTHGSRRSPSTYRLTWLGTPDGMPPTNEWKGIKSGTEALVRVENALKILKKERSARTARRAARHHILEEDSEWAACG